MSFHSRIFNTSHTQSVTTVVFFVVFSGGFSLHPIRCISPQVEHMGETPSPVISPNHSSHRLFLKIASRGAGFASGGVPPDPSRGAPPSTLSGWVSAIKFPSFHGLQRSLPPCDVLEDVARLEAKATFFRPKKLLLNDFVQIFLLQIMGFENHCQILKMSMNIRIKWVELSNVVWLCTQPRLYGQALLQSGCDLHKKRKRTGECPVDEAVDPGESSVMVVEVRASLFFQIPKCQQFQGISHLHIPSSCLPFFPRIWVIFFYIPLCHLITHSRSQGSLPDRYFEVTTSPGR